jgi:hypothetical protein
MQEIIKNIPINRLLLQFYKSLCASLEKLFSAYKISPYYISLAVVPWCGLKTAPGITTP